MDRKVRWGILGCAGIAEKAFIPAVLGSQNGALAGIAAGTRRGPGRGRTGSASPAPTCPTRTSSRTRTSTRSTIRLPNDLHAAWSIRALEAGKHVLCEKPMALDAAEVAAMIRAAGAGGVLLMEGFMYKFHPQIDRTLALVRSGRIGEVRSVHSSFTFRFGRDGANYRWSPARGGGALYDVGCYTLSAARLVFGAEPVSAFARARIDPATGVDMTTAALLEFPGGRFAPCEASFERLPKPAPRRRDRRDASARPGLLGQGSRRRDRGRPRRRRANPSTFRRPTCSA
ncbi:MAG: Gfo/Idh/MocA family oxidoreductase [Candidatus Moduliflexus flocculans]|nr:Gfo/Idh/MocA family oxidoreductase [Candidatus Moduliflexus flocculans]